MNALVKKEIRLLLPSFLIGIVLTLANWFLKAQPFFEYNTNTLLVLTSSIACPAVAVFMALNSLGAEISAGTFSMLLAQPVSRHRIWWTKTSLLAAALFIGGCLWCASLYLHVETFKHSMDLGDWRDVFAGVWLFLLVIYSGALWTVLLLRQVAAAFWFTLLAPGVVLALIVGLWPEKYSTFLEPALIAGLLIYSVAGFWFARRLFLRAQDVQWTGGTIALPEMRGAANLLAGRAGKRFWRPKAALFGKELQLHQSQFIVAGVLLVLHLGVLVTRKFAHIQRNSALELLVDTFWGLWLVLPVLVGAVAVAEERKLGTLAGQLCLPVKRRTQFAVKLRVVLLLSALFGGVMPLLLEGLRILPDIHFLPSVRGDGPMMNGWQIFFWMLFQQIQGLAFMFSLAGIAMAIGFVAFFASTLARNTLQALAPTVLGILVMGFLLIAASGPESFVHYPLWRGWLAHLIGVPAMVIVLAAMAFWNYQRIDIGGNIWRRNAFVFAAALGFVIGATTAIYHRAWEKLTPFEPSHGAARLSLSNPATLSKHWDAFSVRLPDGRIWTDEYALNTGTPNLQVLVLGDIRLTSLGGGYFYAGSNWMSVVRGLWFQTVGIKTDGTLWVSDKPSRPHKLETGGWKIVEAGDLAQFGNETNWSSVIPTGLSMLLVKNDGTLWRWGATNWDLKHQDWPGLQSFTPHRLGTESNWAEVFLVDSQFRLRKTDGSLWTTWYDHHKQQFELEPGFSLQRSPLSLRNKWRGMTRIWNYYDCQLGVRIDGTFCIMADQRLDNQSHSYEWTEADLQLGKETNWVGVAGHYENIVTLKDDGTLWLWDFHHDYRYGWIPEHNERKMLEAKPVRLGTHSDWIAITGFAGGIISLAADGSLWYWPLESLDYIVRTGGSPVYYDNSNSHFESLLDVSRKPQLLGNVFGKAD
jgi:hypothetical protein